MVRVSFRYASLAAGVALVLTQSAPAQTLAGKPAAVVTRGQLVAKARVADSLGLHEEAFLLRTRLRDGDFNIGDVIIANFEGPPGGLSRRDSLVVQAGRLVRLGEPLGNVDLTGVLRFEVEDVLRARVDKYFKNEVVTALPLIRLTVSGAARAPGFYHFPPDVPLSDVIMRTGGVGSSGGTSSVDMHNITVKRGERTVWSGPDIETALSTGMTINQLGLESGDEIVVGSTSTKAWTVVLQYGLPLVSAILIQQLIQSWRR